VEQIEVGGRHVAFRRAGSGPAVVLLHGGVCDGRVWREQLESLADRYTVVVWDAPGCGGSADPPETFRLPDYADCLAALVDALGLERPAIVGHSWGSGLALELYRRHPALPGSLVLVGGYAGWAGSLPADEVERRLRFALEVAGLPPGAFDPTSMPGLFSPLIPTERHAELVAIMRDIRPAGTRAMAHAFAEADLRDVLATVDVPTLELHGADDARSSLDVARALHSAIPGSELVVLPGLGHEPYLEDPEAFEAELVRFLNDVVGVNRD